MPYLQVESLLTEICDTTSIAEFELKVSTRKLKTLSSVEFFTTTPLAFVYLYL